jgi:5-methylcytosine-specific restriction endonuclease McrA
MKIDRNEVWLKYDKHCAYCGKEIEFKNMQVDHIVPKRNGGTDEISNLNPSCRICNHYKRALTLSQYRFLWLGGLYERLLKQYTIKVALQYDMIILKPFCGKFYFEVINENDKS